MLLSAGVPVPIGSRSLDILIALARQPGKVVGKQDLIGRVWKGSTVSEGALRVHVNGLRKALGDGRNGARYILNVPGQGYMIVAPGFASHDPSLNPVMRTEARASSLPPAPRRLIGREDDVRSLVEQVRARGLVSLVGPGGIGKTTVAIEAMHRLSSDFGANIHFINLSAVSDPAAVNLTIAAALGVRTSAGSPLSEILSQLGGSKSLLVLDSCEHLVEPLAALVEAIGREAPLASLLATTREPLMVDGEHLMRLSSLACPPEGASLGTAESLAYPAVELFVERVAASVAGFRMTDQDAPLVADICRKLDGVALALELVAGRVDAYGLAGTAQLLDRRLGLLWRGRRTAPPRHQTLQAALDWSYDLLDGAERAVLERLAVFAGTFTLEAAEAVASDAEIDGAAVIGIVGSLVAKSLLTPFPDRSPLRYRLLDTTRNYALAKLANRPDAHDVARRHAECLSSNLTGYAERRDGSTGFFMEIVNDVRSALEWCFAHGEIGAGVTLAAAAATPLLEHALCDECYRWTVKAIENLTKCQKGTALELGLQTSLGWAAMFSPGKGVAVHGAFLRGLEIASSDPDPHQQLMLLNGLSFVLSRQCDHAGGLALAERAAQVARDTADPDLIALSDWALGVCHHLCGHQGVVLGYCDTARLQPVTSPYARRIADYGYDYRGRALIARARALWLLGFPEEAVVAARQAISAVEELRHPISIFVVLVYAATVFIWCREWEEAKGVIGRLRAHSQAQTLVYRDIGAALEAMLNCCRRGSADDAEGLRQSLARLVEGRHLILVPLCRTTLADALLAAGLVDEAREVIEPAAIDLGPQVDGPEILRIMGVVAIASGQVVAGEDFLRRAIALAREQSALAWELRAALSLARMAEGDARGSALSDLRSICGRFPGGSTSNELEVARRLLRESAV